MKNFNWKNLFESQPLVQVVGVVIIVSLLWQTAQTVQKNYSLQQQVDKLSDEIAVLQLRNQQLKYRIDYYKTDEYLEVAVRDSLGLRAAGETVLALSQDDPPDPPTLAELAAQQDKPQYEENLDQWFYFLFHREP
jgi:cell division protein FtsB